MSQRWGASIWFMTQSGSADRIPYWAILTVFASFLALIGAAAFLLFAFHNDEKAQGAAITIVGAAAGHLAKETGGIVRSRTR